MASGDAALVRKIVLTGSRRSADKLIRRHYDDIYRFVAH